LQFFLFEWLLFGNEKRLRIKTSTKLTPGSIFTKRNAARSKHTRQKENSAKWLGIRQFLVYHKIIILVYMETFVKHVRSKVKKEPSSGKPHERLFLIAELSFAPDVKYAKKRRKEVEFFLN